MPKPPFHPVSPPNCHIPVMPNSSWVSGQQTPFHMGCSSSWEVIALLSGLVNSDLLLGLFEDQGGVSSLSYGFSLSTGARLLGSWFPTSVLYLYPLQNMWHYFTPLGYFEHQRNNANHLLPRQKHRYHLRPENEM